jgi:hypothetical protein
MKKDKCEEELRPIYCSFIQILKGQQREMIFQSSLASLDVGSTSELVQQ